MFFISHITCKFLFWPTGEGNSWKHSSQINQVENRMIQHKEKLPFLNFIVALKWLSFFYVQNSGIWKEVWIQFYLFILSLKSLFFPTDLICIFILSQFAFWSEFRIQFHDSFYVPTTCFNIWQGQCALTTNFKGFFLI